MPPPTPDFDDLAPDEVERRFRWARMQGRPGYLWPDVPVALWRAWLGELVRVTGAVLGSDGRATLHGPHAGPGSARAAALSVAAYTSGLGPLLGSWIEEDRLGGPAAYEEALLLHLQHARGRAHAMRSLLDRTVTLLTRADVPVTVLKGAHTSVAYFTEPATRPSADVDLLVPATDFERAGEILASAGFRPGERQARPRKATWIPAGTPRWPRTLRFVHAEDPRSVEIHDSLAQDFFGVRTVDLAGAGREPCGRVHPDVRVLRVPELAAYLALHASRELHHLQVIRLVELGAVLREGAASGRLPAGAVADVLGAAGAAGFAFPALDLTEKLLPGTVEPTLLDEARRAAPPRMTRYLATQTPATVQRMEGVTIQERFIWCRGVAQTSRRLIELVAQRDAGGSARPPGRAWRDRVLGLLRGRVQVRPPRPAVADEAPS